MPTARTSLRLVSLHAILLLLLAGAACAESKVTLLVPSKPNVEAPLPAAQPERKGAAPDGTGAGQTVQNPGDAAADIGEDVDVLITMMRPFKYEWFVIDMPQLFAVLRYDDATPSRDGVLVPERTDLLGDVEEIRYLDQKAWAANVGLSRPGLYQFIIEARPWWDALRNSFVQHYVKTALPVYGVERGWDEPVGQRLEVLPLSRPFGLLSPALFAGKILLNGRPLPHATVRMSRINTDRSTVPTPWHEELAAAADSNGTFSFVLNQPGWWCCMTISQGEPLKGPDGEMRPLELGALFWLYVDAPAADARKH